MFLRCDKTSKFSTFLANMSCAQESKVIILIKTVVIYFILLRREAEKPQLLQMPHTGQGSVHTYTHTSRKELEHHV